MEPMSWSMKLRKKDSWSTLIKFIYLIVNMFFKCELCFLKYHFCLIIQLTGEWSPGQTRNFWDISCEKSRFYAKKIIFPWIRPCINQMKQSINIRCMQHFLYFESHTKSLKLLHIIVCISSAFTISTYFINECMYLDEISRKQWYRVHVQTMVQK